VDQGAVASIAGCLTTCRIALPGDARAEPR
jgi:hypothetical protein